MGRKFRIIPQYQDEIARLFPPTPEQWANSKSGLSTKTITFQVTDACNLCCTYCYQINKHEHVMPFEVAKAFIDLLMEDDENTEKYMDEKGSNAVVIEFIGGEPLLQIDLIDQITDYFVEQLILHDHPWQYHYMVSICSNGLLYFDPKWQEFIRKHHHHLSFSISIDGNKELHDACRIQKDGCGSYDIAMAGVNHYREHWGGDMGSKMTLAPGNIDKTYEAIKGIVENGYGDINLNCVYEAGWTMEHAKILYQQLKQVADFLIDEGYFEDGIRLSIFEQHFFHPKETNDLDNWCGGTGAMVSVDWKGDIYPCIRYMESSLGEDQKPIIIGNVWTGFLATEEQCACNDCLKCDRRTESTDECFYCPVAEGCSWCSAYNYQIFGTVDRRATYICWMHKARALANAYYWNKGFICTGQNKRMKIYLPDEDALQIIDQDELDYLHMLEM